MDVTLRLLLEFIVGIVVDLDGEFGEATKSTYDMNERGRDRADRERRSR